LKLANFNQCLLNDIHCITLTSAIDNEKAGNASAEKRVGKDAKTTFPKTG